jgi:hypothetical protein
LSRSAGIAAELSGTAFAVAFCAAPHAQDEVKIRQIPATQRRAGLMLVKCCLPIRNIYFARSFYISSRKNCRYPCVGRASYAVKRYNAYEKKALSEWLPPGLLALYMLIGKVTVP